VVVVPPIDYSTYSYYSGTWTQDGTTYGNSYYPNSLGLTKRIEWVQIYTYDEYTNLSKAKSKQKQGMMKESESMMMSAPTNGLIAEYLLDGNANDTSGNGNNGIPSNITWVPDRFWIPNHAAQLSNTSIDFWSGMSLNPNFITLSFWTNGLSTTWSSTGTIIRAGNDSSYILDINNYTPVFHIKRTTTCWNTYPDAVGSSIKINPWNWDHVVGTFDGTTIRIYINGIETWSKNVSSVGPILYCPQYKFHITIWNYNWIATTSVNMDNFRLYNRALSLSEIQDLYLEASTGSVSNDTNVPYVNNYFSSNPLAKSSPFDNFATNSNPAIRQQNADLGKTATDEKNLADPVNLATWEFTYANTLMNIPGVGLPYQLKINYKNQATYNGPLGFNWDHNYNQYLSGETNGNVLYYNGQLGTFRFIKSGGVWLRNEWLRATLVLSGAIYSINYDNGNKANFNSINRLWSLQDINGNALNFTYSGSYLLGVTDTLGHTMSYSYYSHNRLKTVTDFSGRKADFIYYTGSTASGNLYDLANIILTNSGVTKTIGFEYSTNTTDPLSHNIVKLIDAKGQIYVENTYTAEDRVATQKYGSASFGYTYTLSGSQITQNTVLDKLGNRTDYTYDASGNNTAIRYYNPTQSSSVLYTYTYNTLGLMTSEKRPRGNGYTYTYDANGNLTMKRFKTDADAVDNATDLVTNSTYNARNEKMTETNPNAIQIVYTRDTQWHILTETQSGVIWWHQDSGTSWSPSTQNTTKTYTYLTNWLLNSITSPEWRLTKYSYTAGQLTTLVRGVQDAYYTSTGTFTYSPHGTVLSARDGDGFIRNYGYTVFDLVSTGTTAEWIVTSYAYDTNNNKIRETRYITGGTMKSYYYYDSLDHLTSSVVDTNVWQTVTTTYTYDNNGNITDKKIWNWATVHYTYNEFSKPTEECILLVPGDTTKDIVTTYTYDTNNNLSTKTDPRGYTTTYTYDLYDRIIQETNTQGTYTTYTYNKDNTVDTTSTYTSTWLILTKQTTLYDGRANKIAETNYLNPASNTGALTKKYIRNKDTELWVTLDENGVFTWTYYDGRWNKQMIVDAVYNHTEANYNKRDIKTSEAISDGIHYAPTAYLLDRDGRATRSTNKLGKYKSFIYDNLGSIVKSTDEMGRITDIVRDYRGLMTRQTTYSGSIASITNYTYDERGNMTSITDPMSHTTSYQYDGINRNTRVIYPDLKEVTMTYDKSSNLISKTDPNGTVVSNTYNSLNQLTGRSISLGAWVGGATSESYSYDALGRMLSGSNNIPLSYSFTYDALSRVSTETQKQLSGMAVGYVVKYNYSATSDLTGITLPDNKVQTYVYDKAHRLLSTTYSGQIISTNTYTGILQNKTTYLNGKITNYTYDTINRLTSINAGTGMPLPSYTYNDASDILTDGTKSYTYDGLARLIRATPSIGGALIENYVYDKTGNRTNSTLNTGTTTYTTNTLDQYTTLTGSIYTGSITYDNNGNIKTQGNRTYNYDYNNRLIQVNSWASIIATFQYDNLGRRAIKTDYTKWAGLDESTLYTYAWDNLQVESRLIKFYNGSWQLMGMTLPKNYINAPWTDQILAYDAVEQITSTGSATTTKRYYYHTNQLGSVIAITNSTGTVIQTYSYDSFGRAYVSNSGTLTPLDTYSGSTYSNTRLYTGREYDKETNLYYLRARYYNANTGKFISRDPVWQSDQVNLYTYVANSPLKYVDRMGREKVLILVWKSFTRDNDFKYWADYQIQKYLNQGVKTKNIILKEWVFDPSDFNNAVDEYNWNIQDIVYLTHGAPDSLWRWAINRDNVNQLNSINKNLSGILPTLTLIACNTGKWANPIAKDIANQLRIPVNAADWYVWIDKVPDYTVQSTFGKREDGEPTFNTVQNVGNNLVNMITNIAWYQSNQWKTFTN
jgi:RHS repeat-associated protein